MSVRRRIVDTGLVIPDRVYGLLEPIVIDGPADISIEGDYNTTGDSVNVIHFTCDEDMSITGLWLRSEGKIIAEAMIAERVYGYSWNDYVPVALGVIESGYGADEAGYRAFSGGSVNLVAGTHYVIPVYFSGGNSVVWRWIMSEALTKFSKLTPLGMGYGGSWSDTSVSNVESTTKVEVFGLGGF